MSPPDQIAALVTARIARTHGWLIDAASELSDDQLAWRAGAQAPPIGFHLWHVARWADRLQAKLPEMLGARPQREVWQAEAYARHWLVEADQLGFESTGMGMDEDTSAQIPVAGKDVLVRYARQAFEACNRAVEQLGDADLLKACPDVMYGRDAMASVGQFVIMHMSHAGRHLGMIEALKGILGERGSATM